MKNRDCFATRARVLSNQNRIKIGEKSRVCQRVWAGITPGYLTKLFKSKQRRIEAVIKAGEDILNIRTSYIMVEVLSDLNK